MTTPDLINGLFEGFGALMLTLNVRRLHRDKQVRGTSLVAATLWTLWGYWNIYYYPHLGQWFSFVAGIGVVIVNTIWLSMALYYECGSRRVVREWSEKYVRQENS